MQSRTIWNVLIFFQHVGNFCHCVVIVYCKADKYSERHATFIMATVSPPACFTITISLTAHTHTPKAVIFLSIVCDRSVFFSISMYAYANATWCIIAVFTGHWGASVYTNDPFHFPSCGCSLWARCTILVWSRDRSRLWSTLLFSRVMSKHTLKLHFWFLDCVDAGSGQRPISLIMRLFAVFAFLLQCDWLTLSFPDGGFRINSACWSFLFFVCLFFAHKVFLRVLACMRKVSTVGPEAI